ncbi:MAG: hypothetical protein SFV18_13840 [Bryobacteraceae bacterium]|nr:hypothetical protein [Bryobacteraceae bacterium]
MRFAVAFLAASSAFAHVGSPDVYFDGQAGPYRVYVTVRAPQVIPGVAEIELRIPTDGVEMVKITPTPLTGAGAKFAPTPDIANRSAQDPKFYTGSLWMMSSGSWQVRVKVEGSRGEGELRVPVPALARRTLEMDTTLGGILAGLMVFLAVGLVSIFGAASREGKLAPGVEAPPENVRRSRWVMAGTAAAVVAILYLGGLWWKAEAAGYSRIVYKPLGMKATVEGSKLRLALEHTGWFQSSRFDDLIPDHDHLMHLFVVGEGRPERFWHLHPRLVSDGIFEHDLPEIPAGRYRLFADIVHRGGLPETVVAEIEILRAVEGELVGDDSAAAIAEGYKMTMDYPGVVRTREMKLLTFRLLDPAGRPAEGMELYLGMPAHAAVLRDDFSVFAHLHPTGTVPMASLMLARDPANPDPHAGHAMTPAQLPSEVTFPYGFPQPGNYRMYVQMKRSGKVETGVFEVKVVE